VVNYRGNKNDARGNIEGMSRVGNFFVRVKKDPKKPKKKKGRVFGVGFRPVSKRVTTSAVYSAHCVVKRQVRGGFGGGVRAVGRDSVMEQGSKPETQSRDDINLLGALKCQSQ